MLNYSDFVFIKGEEGKYQRVNCLKLSHLDWKFWWEWEGCDKNDKIVVFVYQGKGGINSFFFTLAFTTKENFANRFNENFDLNKICKLGVDFKTFLEAQEFLCNELGYKKENIFEETNDINIKYELGIFDF